MSVGPEKPLVFGFHPVRELLRHRPHDVKRVVIAARQGKRRAEIEAAARRHKIAIEAVAASVLDEVAAASRAGGRENLVHNGFAAEVSTAGSEPHGESDRRADDELIVLLEDIQDPRNLGALVRVCEGAGVGRVLVRDRGSAPMTATAAKASAGATEWVDIERVTNSTQEIERLQKDGYWVYGADAEGVAPWDLDLTGKVVLVMGGEAGGMRRRTRESCDALVGLPMRGKVSSLNVATAASALLYEAVRQRLGSER